MQYALIFSDVQLILAQMGRQPPLLGHHRRGHLQDSFCRHLSGGAAPCGVAVRIARAGAHRRDVGVIEVRILLEHFELKLVTSQPWLRLLERPDALFDFRGGAGKGALFDDRAPHRGRRLGVSVGICMDPHDAPVAQRIVQGAGPEVVETALFHDDTAVQFGILAGRDGPVQIDIV